MPGARFSVKDLTRCWSIFLALAHRTTCRFSSRSLQSMKSNRTMKHTYFLPRSCLLLHQFWRLRTKRLGNSSFVMPIEAGPELAPMGARRGPKPTVGQKTTSTSFLSFNRGYGHRLRTVDFF
ncbi:hypothetical protein SCHPADRAFT_901643 [Schizopora paradoxa]|uniref:Uncharacterized protein n=1 Tax=Schizopora paradoxa TaxID=27342 RepID=A0A0H2RX83_9AGAM|nr:hypothetical protein SCHPADRAFT_901643 [Schizopora paradoxa]